MEHHFNKKQICKCYFPMKNYNNNSNEPLYLGKDDNTTTELKNALYLYGISSGNGYFLLENGNIGIEKDKICPTNNIIYNSKYHYHTMKKIEAFATRNVPEGIKEVLLNKYKPFETVLKLKIEVEEKLQALSDYESSLSSTKRDIIAAKGELTNDEFIEEFKNNLSIDVLYDLDHNLSRGYDGFEGVWTISVYKGIKNNYILEFEREVWIDKWIDTHDYPFVFEEYDKTLYIDNENCPEYKNILKKYHKELDINIDDKNFAEYLVLGDKNSLEYRENYKYEFNKPLTKEFAKELADKLCNKNKELDK